MASASDPRQTQKDAADQSFDYMFKLLIIGNSSVGKTSFLFRYADDSFTSAFVSTVGIDFKVKTVYRNEKRVKLQIWVRKSSQQITFMFCKPIVACVLQYIVYMYFCSASLVLQTPLLDSTARSTPAVLQLRLVKTRTC